jgi:phage gp29-like protein
MKTLFTPKPASARWLVATIFQGFNMAHYVQLKSGVVITETQYAENLGSKPDLAEIATASQGRDVTRGWIPEHLIIPTGDSVLAARGGHDYLIYEELARDDQVKTCRGQRELALIAKEWGVDPGDSSFKAKKAAERLKQLLGRLAWDDKTQKMLSAVLYGHAVAECLWATDGTEITLSDIKVRNRRRFGYLPSGELRMKTTSNYADGEALPPAKFWAFSCGADHDDEPYGLGLGHYLYWPVMFKKGGMKSWLYFLDKFSQPTAVGKYPAGTDKEGKDTLLRSLAAIQSSTAIRIPEGMQIELLQAARSGTADYTALVDRMNAAISKVYLGHSAAADETPGKLGGSSDATDVREDLIKADADLVCGSFNRTVAKWLTYYNDGDNVAPPKVWRKTEPPEDLKSCADKDKIIFDMGYKPTLKYVQEKYNGEYVEATVALPNNPTGAAPGSATSQPGQVDKPAQFAEAKPVIDVDPTPVSAQTELLANAAGSSVKSWVDIIRSKVDNADSVESLRDDLLASYAELDSSELVKVMALAFAAADLSGRYDVSEGG